MQIFVTDSDLCTLVKKLFGIVIVHDDTLMSVKRLAGNNNVVIVTVISCGWVCKVDYSGSITDDGGCGKRILALLW